MAEKGKTILKLSKRTARNVMEKRIPIQTAIAAKIARMGCPARATIAPTAQPRTKQPSVERSHTFSME